VFVVVKTNISARLELPFNQSINQTNKSNKQIKQTNQSNKSIKQIKQTNQTNKSIKQINQIQSLQQKKKIEEQINWHKRTSSISLSLIFLMKRNKMLSTSIYTSIHGGVYISDRARKHNK
jgi:hypothetical protein